MLESYEKPRKLKVSIERYGHIDVPSNMTLLELKNYAGIKEDPEIPIVAALYNNRIIGLDHPLKRNCRIRFINTSTEAGREVYGRSLSILLHAAFREIMGKRPVLKIEHSLEKGFFYSYHNRTKLTRGDVEKIESRMKELVQNNLPFEKYEYDIEDALELFEKNHLMDRYYLLKYSDRTRAIIYRLLSCIDLTQGPIVPSTGYLKKFELDYYPPGLILKFPTPENPLSIPEKTEQKKLFSIYSEQREWSRILDVDCAGKLNRSIIKGKIDNLIWVLEGLHEKKIAQIADEIRKNRLKKRIILLAGPSSSGKTTFAKRLTIQLLVNGIEPEVISLDNYYLPRDKIPRDENGNPDLENLYALDVELINKHLSALLRGEKILIPKFDFKTGKSLPGAKELKLAKNQVVIVEGIHGMNEKLTERIDKEQKYKIYISALTQLNLDYLNRIPTSNIRLLRRIVRDYQFRGYTAVQTIRAWPAVRRGEERNIFPFQEEADIMFNSSLVYEMSVLRGYAEPLLKDVDEEDEAYITAKQLLQFVYNFLPVTPDKVPRTSILREFIGGSGFRY